MGALTRAVIPLQKFLLFFLAHIFNILHHNPILFFQVSFLMLHSNFTFLSLLLWRMVCLSMLPMEMEVVTLHVTLQYAEECF